MLLVVYVASQMASGLFMAPTAQKSQRIIFMVMPLVFVFVIAHFPAGLVLYWVTTNLWTVGQGLITRRLVQRTPAPAPERRSSRTAPKEDDGHERQRRLARADRLRRRLRPRHGAARGRCGARRARGGGDERRLTVEATGETVGEAKWAALRELEQRHPALDKAAVRFEVVSEGERGLLGVGYEPARVLAHLPAEAAAASADDGAQEEGQAAEARWLVSRIVTALGIEASLDVDEGKDTITVTVSGSDVAILIGRHGQTIDAVQYLLNVIQYRAYGDAKKDVVVDAEGYRERRRATLEALADEIADRVRESGERRGARADDVGRAEGRPPAPEGCRRRRDRVGGDGAESLRRRPSRLTTTSAPSSRRRA